MILVTIMIHYSHRPIQLVNSPRAAWIARLSHCPFLRLLLHLQKDLIRHLSPRMVLSGLSGCGYGDGHVSVDYGSLCPENVGIAWMGSFATLWCFSYWSLTGY